MSSQARFSTRSIGVRIFAIPSGSKPADIAPFLSRSSQMRPLLPVVALSAVLHSVVAAPIAAHGRFLRSETFAGIANAAPCIAMISDLRYTKAAVYHEDIMRVAKWGNSLAVRLPKRFVDALSLKAGDELASYTGPGNNALPRLRQGSPPAPESATPRCADRPSRRSIICAPRRWKIPPTTRFRSRGAQATFAVKALLLQGATMPAPTACLTI